MMYELMAVKKEDDEFVLQIAHSLTSLLACQATRSVLLDSTQVHSMRHIDLITGSSYAARILCALPVQRILAVLGHVTPVP